MKRGKLRMGVRRSLSQSAFALEDALEMAGPAFTFHVKGNPEMTCPESHRS